MSAAELAMGDLVAGKYRIESVLGRGGMGAVYLATNEDLGRRVAIKVLLAQLADDEVLLKRFRQEARTAAAIGHPGIVDVLDLGTTADGSPFIVMEALDGATLGARMARERRMDIHDAVDIVAQALDALAAAHDKDILHRDLKPDNLFLVAKPVAGVKILDFGISKLGGDASEDVSLTRTGAVFGTPLYMSPEQAKAAKHITAASDVYSMGAILYQMLAGRTPFIGASYNELIANVLNGPSTPIAGLRKDLPPRLAALVDRMLSRDPAQRPQTAREARAELLASVEGVERAAKPAIDPIGETAAPLSRAIDPIGDTAPPAASTDPRALAETAATAAPGQLGTSVAIGLTTAPPARARRGLWWLAGALVAGGGGAVALVLARGGGHPAATTFDAGPATSVLSPADAARPVAPPDAPPAPIDAPIDAAPPRDADMRTVRKDHPTPPPDAPPRIPVPAPADAPAAATGLELDRNDPFKPDAGR